MRETFIVGVGMTPFGRFPETPLGESRRAGRRRSARGRQRRPERGARRLSSPTRPRARWKDSTASAGRPRSTAPASAMRRSSTSRTPAPRPRPRSTSLMSWSGRRRTIACSRSERKRWSCPIRRRAWPLSREAGTCPGASRRSTNSWRWDAGSRRRREPKRTSRTASSWTSTPPFAVTTWRSSARRSGRWRRSAPRTISIPSTTRARSIAGAFRSRRCSPLVRSSGR